MRFVQAVSIFSQKSMGLISLACEDFGHEARCSLRRSDPLITAIGSIEAGNTKQEEVTKMKNKMSSRKRP